MILFLWSSWYTHSYSDVVYMQNAWSSQQIRKIVVARPPGKPKTFSPPPILKKTDSYRSRHASRHVRHARAVMHVGITNPQWRETRSRHSRHSRRMHNSQFYVSGERTIPLVNSKCSHVSVIKISTNLLTADQNAMPLYYLYVSGVTAFCNSNSR